MDLGRGIRVGVDIGGTFTDCVVLAADGTRLTSKALTTPDDPSRGVLDVLHTAAGSLETTLGDLLSRTTAFVHGTTVGTNTLVERRGAATGLLMTRGHEETITIGRVRQKVAGLSEREKIHITHLKKAEPPIVLPTHIRGVTERIDVRGDVVVPLQLDEAAAALDELVDAGVEAVALCLLWSFLNPTHEEQLRDFAEQRHPGLYVSASVDVAPVFGEYERAVSTVFNAYLGPRVGGYLTRLEGELQAHGMTCSLLLMQTNGGLSTVDAVRDRPLLTVDSGPAGGVLGARFHAGLLDERNVICADVGGTTFDVGLVFADRVQMDPTPVIEQYAYLMPKIYVKSIGAGGGSIAWVDAAGSLRVGPHSAGSDPGPVCYGRGGTQPTVTDAHLALGYLDPEFRLGGKVTVDKAAAEDALRELGATVGMDVTQVAAGIAAISNAQMADLVRKVTVERGLDPREFVVLAYGGAGPVFATFLARQIGAKVAYVPADSGVFSALGMLTTDLLFQEERSLLLKPPLGDEELERLRQLYASLDARILDQFAREGFDRAEVSVAHSLDMRLAMQVHELEVDVPDGDVDAALVERVREAFIDKYELTYGRGSAYTAAGVEMVKFRATGTIPLERPSLAVGDTTEAGDSFLGKRDAYFDRHGFVPTALHAGARLRPGQVLEGPAIVQRMGDTVVVPPEARAEVDSYGSFVISWE